ncbi:hypothetical protein BVRB_029070, partial [Beta vulgaris subsp. vulgaris]
MAVGSEMATIVAPAKKVISESQSLVRSEVEVPISRPQFTLSPHNPISACSFFWIFRLLWKSLRCGPENIDVSLDKRSRALPASDALSQAWKQQPRSLLQATFSAFGTAYLMQGIWKLAWAACTWLCAYWILQQMMRGPTFGLSIALLVAAAVSAVTF